MYGAWLFPVLTTFRPTDIIIHFAAQTKSLFFIPDRKRGAWGPNQIAAQGRGGNFSDRLPFAEHEFYVLRDFPVFKAYGMI